MDIGGSSIRVAVLEETGQQVLMEGTFTHKINTETSVWSLEPGKCIVVSVASLFHCLHECVKMLSLQIPFALVAFGLIWEGRGEEQRLFQTLTKVKCCFLPSKDKSK